ncbi:uncharacterized protein LOC141695663 [Apium graveolens]|uniref:uncharacterized protein LOC141695663 n=1 Tax=Apium graveolens TaxID=4045 RepID=UPI003D7B74B3
MEANAESTYLGLPNTMSHNKIVVLGYLKNRVKDKIEGWDKKTLSKGGNELLLKTLAQSVSNYVMNMFLLPKLVFLDIERIMSKFWWRTVSNKEPIIRWMSWDRIYCSKANRDESSLVSKILKARYYPNGSFLTSKLGNNPSYCRSILEAQVLINKGAVLRVGSGRNVNIQNDPWLNCVEDIYVQTVHEALEGKTVSNLMCINEKKWDVDLIKDIFLTGMRIPFCPFHLTIVITGSGTNKDWYL